MSKIINFSTHFLYFSILLPTYLGCLLILFELYSKKANHQQVSSVIVPKYQLSTSAVVFSGGLRNICADKQGLCTPQGYCALRTRHHQTPFLHKKPSRLYASTVRLSKNDSLVIARPPNRRSWQSRKFDFYLSFGRIANFQHEIATSLRSSR